MSHNSNQIVSTWKDVESLTRRMRPQFRKQRCSNTNLGLYQDAVAVWVLACIDVLQSVGSSFSDYRRWISLLSTIDIQEVMLLLKAADSLLVREPLLPYDDFKHRLRSDFPFAGAIIAPIKPVFAAWHDDQSYHAFAGLRTFFCFISRLSFKSKDLESEAMTSYLLDEQNIKRSDFTMAEKALVETWYPRTLPVESFFRENFSGKHGDGSTADAGSDLGEKYTRLGWDIPLRILHKRSVPDEMYPRTPGQFDRVSRLAFVPKSALSYRSISMEPATLMWHQQGFLSAWVRDLELRNKAVRRRFHPSYQEPNRDLAYEGSLDGSYSTIDLSSASDSVSWDLVKTWFRDTPLYSWMLLTRSYATRLPDKRVMELKKFAPMGSALCFPTECMVFAAITECAILEHGGDPQASRYRVYGDDIVVETCYAEAVIARLQKNGFRVNAQKTFCSSEPPFFRESCGGEYLDGFDVTPLRLSRWFSGYSQKSLRPGQALALLELANGSYYRCPSVRRRIVCVLADKTDLPFCSSGDGGIFSPNPTNYNLERRYNDDWQRDEVSVSRILAKRLPHNPDLEDVRLFEHLRRTNGRASLCCPEDTVSVCLAPPKSLEWSTTWAAPEDFL